MSFLSGKQAFLQILKDEGVDVMFGNPGTTELPLMDGLVREPGIRYVLALQEAVAISMADGYAQASGKLGVVNVHTSPGLGNAMGMLYDAYEAGTPLLVTAGQHDQAMNLTEPIAEATGWQRHTVRGGEERAFDLKRSLQILKQAGYDGPLNFEYNHAEDDERVGVAKGIAYTREVLATI